MEKMQEMSNTIDTLTRDFKVQQAELGRLRQILQFPSSGHSLDVSSGLSRHKPAAESSASHIEIIAKLQAELEETRRLLMAKDAAFNEVVKQRNMYRLQLEEVEATSDAMRCGQNLQQLTNGTSKFHEKCSQSHQTSTAFIRVDPPLYPRPPSPVKSHSGGDSTTDGRFDSQSSYAECHHEPSAAFWRKQYNDAVQMRKTYGVMSAPSLRSTGINEIMNAPISTQSQAENLPVGGRQPSLKIFSFPKSQQTKEVNDEHIPFGRYMGMNTRQSDIIKERHRMLSK